MSSERPLSPWVVLKRLEEKLSRQKVIRLTPDTALLFLQALRAYLANPSRDHIAAIICMRHHIKPEPCKPLCGRCQETAYELKCMMQGEVNPFGDEEPRRRR